MHFFKWRALPLVFSLHAAMWPQEPALRPAAPARGAAAPGASPGDCKRGESCFKTTCASCHSATSDLKGIGAKYDPFSLQARWLQPRGGRGGGGGRGGRGGGAAATGPNRSAIMVTVTPATGK